MKPPVIIRRVCVTEDTYQFWPASIRTDVDTMLPRDEQGAVPWPVDLLVLSNGFYTVRACLLEGRTHVRALIMDGTLQQAMEDAIVRNAKNSVRFTKSEMQNAVLRMKEMYPQLSARGSALGNRGHATASAARALARRRRARLMTLGGRERRGGGATSAGGTR